MLLAMTQEQPFKTMTTCLEQEKEWSEDRFANLGRSALDAILAVLPTLRQ